MTGRTWRAPRWPATALLAILSVVGPERLWAGNADDRELARRVAAAQVPLEQLAEPARGKVAELLKNAPVYGRGPVEAFPCRPPIYVWLLDHPDWAARGWRASGAKCAPIERVADGSFALNPPGAEVRWETVCRAPGRRVWYVEGSGRAGPLAPMVSIQAVLVLNFEEVRGADGRVGVRHWTEVFAKVEGRAVNWLNRIAGISVDGATRKTLEQLELFYSGMAWYLCEHPEWAVRLLSEAGADEQADVALPIRELSPRR